MILARPSPTPSAFALPRYIDEFDVPTRDSAPLAITADSYGRVWFTESNASKLGMFDPVNQTFEEFTVPGVGDMWGISTDLDGNVWLTQYAGKGSVNPGGAIVGGGTGRLVAFNVANRTFTSIDLPDNGSFPMRVAVDGENRIWFTEFLGGKIGEYDQVSKRLQEYPLPNNNSGPADLTFDRNGSLWFTEAYSQKVGRLNVLTHIISEFNLNAQVPPNVVGSPVGLAVDYEGSVWVADHGGSWIVKFNPVTSMTVHYPTRIPPSDVYPLSIPNGVLVDKEDRVWFSEHGGNSIGYLSKDRRTMIEYTIPSGPISTSLWIALAPNGDVWFAEWAYNKIGVVHTDLNVQVNLNATKEEYVGQAGDKLAISVSAKLNTRLEGNATWDYSWSAYNPNDLSVVFTEQYPNLGDVKNIQTGVQVQLSNRIYPGNYTIAIGLNLGEVRVSTMSAITVETGSKPNLPIYLPAALVAVSLGVLISFRRRLFKAKDHH